MAKFDRQVLEELALKRGTGEEDDGDVAQVSPEAWKLVKGREEEVLLVAQSLAFVGVGEGAKAEGGLCVEVTSEIVREIHRLLVAAYAEEEEGEEAFRKGELVDEATVEAMLKDPTCEWICCEAARGVPDDGALLGVACVTRADKETTKTESREFDEKTKDKYATLRFLAVQPRLRGLCVGQRLLDRIERRVLSRASVLLLCVPSPRASMRKWVERRRFRLASQVPFPVDQLHFQIIGTPTLIIYAKHLTSSSSDKQALLRKTTLAENTMSLKPTAIPEEKHSDYDQMD